MTVTVKLSTALDVVVVPSGAVVTSGPGTGCVVSSGQVVPVKIVASSLGKTLLQVTSGPTPDQVDVYPDPTVPCP